MFLENTIMLKSKIKLLISFNLMTNTYLIPKHKQYNLVMTIPKQKS